MEEPIRVGVVGLGRAGWDIHAKAIGKNPRFKLIAVADAEADRRAEAVAQFGCTAYVDFAELAADPNVELVVIASPSYLHAPMTIAALDAGKHVLCDKPMALNAGESDAMMEAAERSGKVLTLFHIRRLDPDFLKIREILASGVLGPLHEIRLASFGYDRRRDWQTLTRLGGGQLGNHGSHLIDLALTLAGGEWRLAFADLRRVAGAGDAEDHVKVLFRGKDGVTVDVEIGVGVFPVPRWLILGKYGSLRGDGQKLEWKYFDPASLPEPTVAVGPAANRKYGSGETLPWVTQSAEPSSGDTTQEFYDRLYASIRDGAPLLVPPAEIRNLIRLFDACRAYVAHEGGMPQ